MTNSETPRQIPLDLATGPRFSRDDLIVGPSNHAAIEIIDRWPDWAAPIVILAGPIGSGKSHLAEIWLEKAKARRINSSELVASLDEGLNQAALLEDIGEAPVDETALFHLINNQRQANTSLLLTSRKWPRDWNIKLPDLLSRLLAATVVEIAEPDDALLSAVIAKLFADRQVNVEPNVISYLVNRMERSLAAAVDIVDRLDRLALEKHVRISRALAATIVSDADPRQVELDF